jgi:PAS domain S-box-containing protein
MIRPDDVKEEAFRNFEEIIEGKLNESFLPIETKSGIRIMVETKFKKGTWNETPCWFIVSKDISAIKLSEEKFSKAFHTAVSLLAISDVETQKLVEVNETWLKVLGYTREEVIGKTPTELELLVFPEDGEELRNKYLNNESIRDIEISFRCKNGEIRTGLFSAEDLKLGQSRSVLSVIVDITERKKMELELLEARNEAEKANDAKSEFLSRMSHELRTPMNSILGFVQLLERGDLNPKQQKATKHIHSSGKHLLNLINEVLDISRIEAGRMQLSLEAVSLPTVVRQVVEIIIPQAKEKNVWIDFIENPGDPEFVLSDIQRMKQVLLNLLGNAVKYNRTGGNIAIQYGKNNCEDDGTVILKITDTGSGIRQEDIEKLFTPFERIGAENTPVDGTGLGLAVSKKLVEAMKGKIGVESELGTGSTFWVELHCVPAKKETRFKYPKKYSVLSANGSKKGTVVYVEDNSSNIELVEQILGDYFPGVLLKTISDGSKAFGFILENKADLVFLDLNLPGLKGEEILHQLKMDKAARKIPVIVLSANAMPEKIDKLMSMGADNYIPKPIDVAVFLEVIDKFLSQ